MRTVELPVKSVTESHVRVNFVALLVVVAGALLARTTVPAAASGQADPVAIHDADAATSALIEAAVARYAEAALPLPSVEFRVHDDDDNSSCEGHDGYWRSGRHADRIDICDPTERLDLHELAHAFEHHFVDDVTRDAFMTLHPEDEWRDDSVGHFAQGIERFAEAIAFGLKSEPIPVGNVNALAEKRGISSCFTNWPRHLPPCPGHRAGRQHGHAGAPPRPGRRPGRALWIRDPDRHAAARGPDRSVRRGAQGELGRTDSSIRSN